VETGKNQTSMIMKKKEKNLKTWIEREFSLVNKQVSRIDFD
jgi:hypothetical protein